VLEYCIFNNINVDIRSYRSHQKSLWKSGGQEKLNQILPARCSNDPPMWIKTQVVIIYQLPVSLASCHLREMKVVLYM